MIDYDSAEETAARATLVDQGASTALLHAARRRKIPWSKIAEAIRKWGPLTLSIISFIILFGTEEEQTCDTNC